MTRNLHPGISLAPISVNDLEMLLGVSELSQRQKERIRGVGLRDTQEALRLFYAMDRDDASLSVETYRAERFDATSSDETRSPLTRIVISDDRSSLDLMIDTHNIEITIDRNAQTVLKNLIRGAEQDYVMSVFDENSLGQDGIEDYLKLFGAIFLHLGKLELPSHIERILILPNEIRINNQRKFGPSALPLFYRLYASRELKNRQELRDLDQSMLARLRERGELNTAIPLRRGMTDDQRRVLVNSYYISQGVVLPARELLGYTYHRIRNFWNYHSFPIRIESGRTPEFISSLAIKYDPHDPKKSLRIAINLGIPQDTIFSAWERCGLGQSNDKRRYAKCDDALSVFEQAYSSWPNLTRAEFKSIDPALHRRLLRHKLLGEAIPEFRGYTSDDRQKILNSYHQYKGNAVAAGDDLTWPRRTISKIWRDAGLPDSRTYSRMEKEGRLDEIAPKITE